ncbi:HNH endonuclease [Lacibacter sp. H407]|uniref:HNH endonuclease n=1 Tax=Lacibacter sp. H407 TaxID=3133423 RepID=UPI0030BD4981
MKTYLFAWNPKKWPWEDLEKNLNELKTTGVTRQMWSCISHKSVNTGDRAFLIRLGGKKNGIVGAGYVASDSFLAKHWDGSGRLLERVNVDFEDLSFRNDDPFIPIKILKDRFPQQVWSTQASGIEIKPAIAHQLEEIWFELLQKQSKDNSSKESQEQNEGRPNKYIVTKYERNPHVRDKCIQHYGYLCQVCKIDFEKSYGEVGKDFIHVHHLNPLASIRSIHQIDPIKDLKPLCPNCHSMAHRRKVPFTIEELKKIYKKNTNQ